MAVNGVSGLEFVRHTEITDESKITVPKEVREFLFSDPENTGNSYFWYIDRENDYIILSNENITEDQSKFYETSPTYDYPARTKIPKKVREEQDIAVGDVLHFLTPVDAAPFSVFVWTDAQLEDVILRGAPQQGPRYLRDVQF